ncbi:MAG: DUF1015 domain-containing protein [Proteobacteria bacterium]|nr:MAG: DUF1015 domain-containing protein [Pseudomonadota bacterium]
MADTRLIYPFAGLRPVPEHAAAVAAPPYDVLSSAEARQQASGNPLSFLHISKPEIDLPEGTDPFDATVYAKGGENIRRMIADGVLIRDSQPCYYVYRLTMGGHSQIGLVGAAPVAAYDDNRVRRHEFTQPDKEDDRVRQIDSVDAQTGPVLVVHQPRDDISALLDEVSAAAPLYDVTLPGGVGHTLWLVDDATLIARIDAAYGVLDLLYIADGHHRSAAASRVAGLRRDANPNHRGDEAYNRFLIVAFPADQVNILDYNRVVRDLNGLSPEAFLDRLREDFAVELSDQPVRPGEPHSFGMYMGGEWYRLTVAAPPGPGAPPLERLDVGLLTDLVLAPVLGVGDPRLDPRIDFVGGIRGLDGLAARVDSGEWAVAFALYPTGIGDLMAVADASDVMPPKSTWFEPKLADGLVSYPLG